LEYLKIQNLFESFESHFLALMMTRSCPQKLH
jgi:hypothetical protein